MNPVLKSSNHSGDSQSYSYQGQSSHYQSTGSSPHPHPWNVKPAIQMSHPRNLPEDRPPKHCSIPTTKWPVSLDDVGFDTIDAWQVSIPNMVTLKVEWALYKTSKKFGLVHDISKQAECSDLKRLTGWGQDRPELQGATESLLYAKGEMLYDIQCPRIEASLDLTTNDDRCYKYMPVITGQPPRQEVPHPRIQIALKHLWNRIMRGSQKGPPSIPHNRRLLGGSMSTRKDPLTTYRATNRSPDNPRHIQKWSKGRSLHGQRLSWMGKSVRLGCQTNDHTNLWRKNLPVHGVCWPIQRRIHSRTIHKLYYTIEAKA